MAFDVYTRQISSSTEAITETRIGALTDVISAVVTREHNGVFGLQAAVTACAENLRLLAIGRCIKCRISPYDSRYWTFIIDNLRMTIDKRVHIQASHVSIRALKSPIFPLVWTSAVTPHWTYSLSHNSDNGGKCVLAHGLTITGSVGGQITSPQPRTIRECIMGREGSLADSRNQALIINQASDSTIEILTQYGGTERPRPVRYGINMIDFNREIDLDGAPLAKFSYWTDQTTGTTVCANRAQWGSTTGSSYYLPRVDVQDVSSQFSSQPTVAQVQAAASGMSANAAEYIKVKIAAYQDEIFLGDTIPVIFEDYEIRESMTVTKLVYDAIQDRLTGIELGDIKRTLSTTLTELISKTGVTI